jgi:hypothetical protein
MSKKPPSFVVSYEFDVYCRQNLQFVKWYTWEDGKFTGGTVTRRGTAVAQWLRYCGTNQKVAGSIPDGVMEFFIDINPSDRAMAQGSTQPLTEMSTRCISWR